MLLLQVTETLKSSLNLKLQCSQSTTAKQPYVGNNSNAAAQIMKVLPGTVLLPLRNCKKEAMHTLLQVLPDTAAEAASAAAACCICALVQEQSQCMMHECAANFARAMAADSLRGDTMRTALLRHMLTVQCAQHADHSVRNWAEVKVMKI
jgi:hypothetical protein